MKQTLRTLCSALFVMSLLCMASCNRDRSDRWCSPCEVQSASCSSPCEVQCPPPSPCMPNCSPCQPVCSQPVCSQPTCSPCQPVCSQPAYSPCQPACNDQMENPFFPCDPSAAGCGSGSCYAPQEEYCFGRMNVYQTTDDCVVELCQRAPETAIVGSPYPIEIYITAKKECADVVVNQTLPMDAEFVRSEPCATPDKNKSLYWEFPHMQCGETQKIVVWVKPMKEGCCLAAATVCACPQLCAYTKCGQPVICIRKWGPECVCLYCPVCYTIEVCNSGSATAKDVIVQDTVPEGLVHSSGRRCLTYELGDLCPGDKRTFNVEFCAQKRGCVTNMATVSFCGGPKCTAEATTLINEPCVQVTKSGPDWAFICKVVDYTITVTNPGDLVLNNVIVDDVSPNGTTIVDAPGAEICCSRAIWCIPELCPGETKRLKVSVRSQVTGCLTNKVSVNACSDCGQVTACAEATTCWKGIAATHMCMVDTVDPICIGESTIYRICVTNRGSSDDTNVKLVIRFTDELVPQTFNGPTRGNISRNTVTFEPVDVLAPKQSVEFCVTVKGVKAGDATAEATLTSDALGAPVIDQESTHVY